VQAGVQVLPAALSSDTYRSKSMKFITDWDLFFLKDPCGESRTQHRTQHGEYHSIAQHSTAQHKTI
jgi:hypothetical protein